MFKKNPEPQSLEDFIQQKLNDNDKTFSFKIKEIKNQDVNNPEFNLYIMTKDKDREVRIDGQVKAFRLNELNDFFCELKQKQKDFKIKFQFEALMPQYNHILQDQLEASLEKYLSLITPSEVIRDVHEEKIGKLTVKQQQDMFIDLCCSGNSEPLNKFLDNSVLSESGTAYDVAESTYSRIDFNKHDVIFGLERATSYGYLDVVKTVLENNNTAKLLDFSESSSDLLQVLYFALEKERKEIISYLIDEKEYKLNKEELYFLRKNSSNPLYAEVLNDYESKYSSVGNKPKM